MLKNEEIEKILKPVKNEKLEIDQNGQIKNRKYNKYIDETIKKIEKEIINDNFKVFKEKGLSDLNQLKSDKLTSVGFLFFSIIADFHNYLIGKFYIDNDYHKILSNIHSSSLAIFQEIITLSCSLGKKGIISRFRTLYENYLVSRIIIEKEELAKPFIDHAEVTRLKIISKINKTENESELLKEYKEKYPKNYFQGNYGWAFSIFEPNKVIKLIDIAKIVGIEDYTNLYQISSEYVHSSSFSVFENTSKNIFSDAFMATSIEIFTNHFVHFLKSFKIEINYEILLMNIIYGLRDDYLGG